MTVDRVLAFIGALLWGGLIGVGCGAMIGFIVGYRGGARARRAEAALPTADEVSLESAMLRRGLGVSTLYPGTLTTSTDVLRTLSYHRAHSGGVDAIVATPAQLERWRVVLDDVPPPQVGDEGVTFYGVPVIVARPGDVVRYLPSWTLVLDARSAT